MLDPEGDVVLTGGQFDDNVVEQFCTDEMSVGGPTSGRLQAVPNPATDRLFLTNLPAGAVVTAMDLLGRPVCPPIRMEGQATLATADWPRGWIVLRAESDAGVYTSRVLLR